MKKFIRGMGVGILLTTIVFAIAYMLNDDQISDAEVIKRAEKLGMVMDQQSVIISKEKEKEASGAGVQATGEAAEFSQPEEAQQNVPQPDLSQPEETKVDPIDSTLSSEEPLQTMEPVVAGIGEEAVRFVIQKGEDGKSICRRLGEAGVVQSASEFNRYLSDHAFQNNIATGEFSLRKNMTYEELADIIIHK